MTKTNPVALSTEVRRRLGRNLNGYRGDTIDIAAVLNDCLEAARRRGWTVEEVPVTGKLPLLAFWRGAGDPPRQRDRTWRVYLSSGIHGDEPAGPLAMRRLLHDNRWPPNLEIRICPCLNRAGFIQNRRENPEGCDLNRDYLSLTAAETKAHTHWLQQQPAFDLCLCLHEDWESAGFYVYELNPDNQPSLAEKIVACVAGVCPIDTSESIEDRPAHNGIIRPSVDPRSRPQWPEAFYLLTYKTRLSYTLEAPSDYALDCRVDALVVGAQAALESLARGGDPE